MYESLVFSARLRHSRETEQDIIFAFVREVRSRRRPGPCHAHSPLAAVHPLPWQDTARGRRNDANAAHSSLRIVQ